MKHNYDRMEEGFENVSLCVREWIETNGMMSSFGFWKSLPLREGVD